MLFCLYCLDKPDSAALRQSVRPDHLAFADGLGKAIVTGGPLLSDDAQSMVGSMLVVEAEDMAAMKAIAAADPYAKAGLFQSVTIRPWRQVLPRS